MRKELVHLNFAKGFRGGERQTLLLIHELAKRGYVQKILTRKSSELADRLEGIENLEIVKITKPYFLHLAKVKDAFLVHAHETKGAQFAFFANLLFTIPYVVTRRVDNVIKNNFFNTKIYANAKSCVALSKAIKTGVLQVSKNAKVELIPSAYSKLIVDEGNVKVLKQRFSGKFLLGNIGELDNSHKGQFYLLEAMKMLQVEYPEIHLILLGRGRDEENYKKQVEDLSNVTFEGFVDNVGDYVHSLDLFVFPSLHEGLGSILFDVMQAKVPIAASNVGGIPDIIKDGRSGLLFVKKNTLEIYKAIVKLYKDTQLRDKLAENGYENIENFSAEKMAERYIKVYEHN